MLAARASSASSSALPLTAAGARDPSPTATSVSRSASMSAHRVGREQLRRAHRDDAGEHHDHHQQQRVVGGDEHQLSSGGGEHDELADGERDADRELAAQRPEARAPARERVRQAEHGGAERDEPEPARRAPSPVP